MDAREQAAREAHYKSEAKRILGDIFEHFTPGKVDGYQNHVAGIDDTDTLRWELYALQRGDVIAASYNEGQAKFFDKCVPIVEARLKALGYDDTAAAESVEQDRDTEVVAERELFKRAIEGGPIKVYKEAERTEMLDSVLYAYDQIMQAESVDVLEAYKKHGLRQFKTDVRAELEGVVNRRIQILNEQG